MPTPPGQPWAWNRSSGTGTTMKMPFMITGENTMAFRRGDVVLVPFPYTDLTAAKTRPAVIVSSGRYHAIRSEFLLAFVTSRIAPAHPLLDYVLRDWQQAGLLKPSLVRPKIAAITESLVVYRIGALSARDLREVDQRLRVALALP
ncbi:MAG TPA: type II toxin-antitoxin system PemK/MazF family toxin [Anaerolineae bacterium]|nr:type II toxin-antitoxin system PemK/MazF family toxin [Anaerolineae bacterium]